MAKMTTSQVIAVIRDQVLFLGGLAGIGYQQLTGEVNFILLAIFTTMTGIPGLTNLISMVRGLDIASQSQQQVSQSSDTESEDASNAT